MSDGVGQLDLRDDTTKVRADSIRKWKVSKLYYYETIPAKWDWSLSTAVAKWNGAGGHIKLVRTSHRDRARLFIGYGFIGEAVATSTTGARWGAYVLLNRTYDSEDPLVAANRIGVMTVFTHELGHVLGFGHTTASCSLMRSTIDLTGCDILPAGRPGYYKCRTIDAPLVAKFVRVYGGRAHTPSATWCLIDPLPGSLQGVTFSGGDGTGGPVTIGWRPPRSAPSGSQVTITKWMASSCNAPRTGAEAAYVAPSAGQWVDDDVTTAGNACFAVQLVNRYGAGRAATSHVVGRWVLPPPSAPVIGTLTWDNVAGRFHAPVGHEAGTRLVYELPPDDDPEACPEAYSPTAWNPSVVEDPDRLGDGVGELRTIRSRQCVSFYAVDDETGLASVPTSVVADAPLPTETLEVGAISLEHRMYPYYEVTVSGAELGDEIGYATVPGSCPTEVPSNVSWSSDQPYRLGTGPVPPEFADIYEMTSRARGTNCAMFAVFDWFGPNGRSGQLPGVGTRHGPVVMREFTDDGPLAPSLGEPTWNADAGTFSVKDIYDLDPRAVYDPTNPTVCPDPGQAGAEPIRLWGGANDNWSFTPPASEVCVSFFITMRDSQGVNQNSLPTKKTFVVPSQG